MWHASVRYHGRPQEGVGEGIVERIRKALRDVGDPALGEWWEQGHNLTIHCRRRVTAAEWGTERPIPWGTDLRKTPEGDRRLLAAKCPREWMPDEYT